MFTMPGHKEMQVKTTLRFHLTPVRIAIIKNATNNKCWRGCGEKGNLIYCWCECKNEPSYTALESNMEAP
jgi:hypothetical protein